MRGYINDRGFLIIYRPRRPGDAEMFMECGHLTQPTEEGIVYCGDWCVLFGEPKENPFSKDMEICLCDKCLEFKEFEDRRTLPGIRDFQM